MKKVNCSVKRASVFFLVATLIISFTFITNQAVAQSKWSLTIVPGVNFATKDFDNADLKTGFGFDGTLGYKFMPHLGAYAGWSWNKFSAEQSFVGAKIDFEATGYNFGLQFIHPVSKNSDVQVVAGAGAIYHHIEVENDNGDIIADSGHGWGWQLGAGVSVPLGKRFNFMSGIRYRALSRDLKIGAITTAVDLNYFSLGAGLSLTF